MRRRGSSSVTATMTAFRPTTIEGATAADSRRRRGAPARAGAPLASGSPLEAGRTLTYQMNFALSVTTRRPQLLVLVPKARVAHVGDRNAVGVLVERVERVRAQDQLPLAKEDPLQQAQVGVPEGRAALGVAAERPVAQGVGERQVVGPQGSHHVAVVGEGLVLLVPVQGPAAEVRTVGAGRPVSVRVDAGADRERPPRLERGDAGELPAAEDVLQEARLRAGDLPEVAHDEAVGHVELRQAPLGLVVEHALRALVRTVGPGLAERGVVVALELAAGVRELELDAVAEALGHGGVDPVVLGRGLDVVSGRPHVGRESGCGRRTAGTRAAPARSGWRSSSSSPPRAPPARR